MNERSTKNSNSPHDLQQPKLTPVDRFITNFDRALRSISHHPRQAARPSPAKREKESNLDEHDQRHIAGLMRVNHTGEVCAQALYQGQAATAKLKDVEQLMKKAADEEIDHLVWCEERLKELGSRPSVLNPIWYLLSFSIGAVAGKAGDQWSLGFVAETEHQVCRHLDNHIKQIPDKDRRTLSIIQQMRADEAEHASMAKSAGGADLPIPFKLAMSLMSKVMTKAAYRL